MRNDSESGFFGRSHAIAVSRKWRDERVSLSSGADFKYCTKTRAAMYRQKGVYGFIWGLSANASCHMKNSLILTVLVSR